MIKSDVVFQNYVTPAVSVSMSPRLSIASSASVVPPPSELTAPDLHNSNNRVAMDVDGSCHWERCQLVRRSFGFYL